MALIEDQNDVARDAADQLGVSLSTLYTYVDGKGRPEARAAQLLGGKIAVLATTQEVAA